MLTLTVQKPLPNFTRWEVDDADFFEKKGYAVVQVVMRSPGTTNYTLRAQVTIRDGLSDVVSYLAVPGGAIQDQLTSVSYALSTPTGCADAFAAYRAGVSGVARRDALALWMLANGVAHSSLAGA